MKSFLYLNIHKYVFGKNWNCNYYENIIFANMTHFRCLASYALLGAFSSKLHWSMTNSQQPHPQWCWIKFCWLKINFIKTFQSSCRWKWYWKSKNMILKHIIQLVRLALFILVFDIFQHSIGDEFQGNILMLSIQIIHCMLFS